MYPLYIHNYFICVFSKGVSALKFLSFVCNY